MRPIVTNRVAWSVGPSVTIVSLAKTAEPIEIPFWLWTRVETVIRWGPDPHAWDNFEGKGPPLRSMRTFCRELCKKAEPIEMPFGAWSRMAPRQHVLDGGSHWRQLANTTEPSMCDGDATFLPNYKRRF